MNDKMYQVLYVACIAASKIQLESFYKKIKISSKAFPKDFVTEVDLKSQQAIIGTLSKSMKELGYKESQIGFIGEENLNRQGKHLFIIDPLDGTSNYIKGNSDFCISIAYLYQGKLKAGMLYQPVKEIIYYAEKGKGAFKIEKGKKVKLSVKPKDFKNAKIAFNTSSSPEVTSEILKASLRLKPNVGKIQKENSIILTATKVVEGKYNIALNGRCFVWDIAALKLIIEEAGGVITDWNGREIVLNLEDSKIPYKIITAHQKLVEDICPYLINLSLLLIGSITHSFAKYKDGVRERFGGGVMYGGKTAISLGVDTTVITVGAPDIEPGIEELKCLGIKVYKAKRSISNNFSNDYSSNKRKMFMRSFIDNPIKPDDINLNLKDFRGVILFPIFHEVSDKLLSLFSKTQLVFLDPSGFMKKLGKKKDSLYPVVASPWENIESFKGKVDILKLSNEDLEGIRFPKEIKSDGEKAKFLLEFGFPLVILTRAERSTLIVGKNLPLAEIPTLKVKLLDPAGAGEAFAASFMYKYFLTNDPIQSVIFANKYTGLKISGGELNR